VLWCVAWMGLTADTPEQHPRISPEEKEYIQTSLKGHTEKQADSKVLRECEGVCVCVWGGGGGVRERERERERENEQRRRNRARSASMDMRRSRQMLMCLL
jgi:hypothetical protein